MREQKDNAQSTTHYILINTHGTERVKLNNHNSLTTQVATNDLKTSALNTVHGNDLFYILNT